MMTKGMTDYGGYLEANGSMSFDVNGDNFHVITATSPIYISFDDGKEIKRYQGMGGASPQPYRKITIRSEVAQSITIALGSGGVYDSRANISATLNTTIAPANINESLVSKSIPSGGTVQLVTAHADRKELRIGVKSDNVDGIYFGNSSTSATKQGAWIELGGVDYVTSEGAIYAYNPHPTDAIVVNLLDFRRV